MELFLGGVYIFVEDAVVGFGIDLHAREQLTEGDEFIALCAQLGDDGVQCFYSFRAVACAVHQYNDSIISIAGDTPCTISGNVFVGAIACADTAAGKGKINDLYHCVVKLQEGRTVELGAFANDLFNQILRLFVILADLSLGHLGDMGVRVGVVADLVAQLVDFLDVVFVGNGDLLANEEECALCAVFAELLGCIQHHGFVGTVIEGQGDELVGHDSGLGGSFRCGFGGSFCCDSGSFGAVGCVATAGA